MLFRQEVEMKKCSAYGQVNQLYELPAIPQNVDYSTHYAIVGEGDGVYEKIRGES